MLLSAGHFVFAAVVYGQAGNKKGRPKAPFSKKTGKLFSSLDLGFLELNMLAHDGVIFLDVHFLGHGARVFLRHIEIARVGSRQQLDLDCYGLGHCHIPLVAVPFGASTKNGRANPANL
jgi:hypothetical protein